MPRIAWADFQKAKTCDDYRALLARIEQEFTDHGVAPVEDEISKAYEAAVKDIEKKILKPDQEKALIATYLDKSLPEFARNAAKKTLDEHLAAMQARNATYDECYYMLQVVRMWRFARIRVDEVCQTKPFFKSKDYPGVSKHPAGIFWALLGWGY